MSTAGGDGGNIRSSKPMGMDKSASHKKPVRTNRLEHSPFHGAALASMWECVHDKSGVGLPEFANYLRGVVLAAIVRYDYFPGA